MKYTVKYRLLLPLIIAAIASSSVAGTVNWTGGGGDSKWSNPANWDGAISDGDSLVIENAAVGTTLTLTNDLGSAESPLSIDGLKLGGAGAIRISGNPVSPSTAKDGTFLLTDCGGDGAITDFDIVFPNHDSATTIWLHTTNTTSWTHNGRISAAGNTIVGLKVDHGTADHGQKFYGDISMENGSVDARGGWTDALFDFYGRLSVKDFNRNLRSGTGPNGIVTFHNPSNEFTSVGVTRSGIKANAPGALGNGAELVGGYNQGSYFDIGVYDQTVGKISTPISSDTAGLSNSGHYITGSGSTLMIAATESFTCDFKYQGSVNVVWNPSGDCTYTGTERTHATSGKIAVKRGTMAFKGATTFSNLAEIEIAAGAKFSLAEVTTASPLPAIKTIWLENGTTCKFALPENSSVANVSVFTGGVPLAAGTYTGEGGTADHVVPWIDGTGVITATAATDRYWSGAADSSWGNAANWTDGSMPANSKATYITSTGSGPVVSGADDYTFNLSGFASNDTTPSFTIDNGAVLSVTGGSLNITNICGKAQIGGGDSSVTSRVEVSGGVLTLHSADSRNASLAIDKGGLLKLTGGETRVIYKHGNNQNPEWMFRMLGGAFEMGNDACASIAVNGNPALLFGTGSVRIGGNARLVMDGNGYGYWTPAAAGASSLAPSTLTVDIAGNAFVTNAGVERAYISGYYDNTRTVVSVRENAVVKLPKTAFVGYARLSSTKYVSTYGELNISGNAKVASGMYGLFVAHYGTSEKPSSGKVAMSGGELDLSFVNQSATAPNAYGLAIGYNPYSGGFTNIDNTGVFELSGGTVKNTSLRGSFVVGEGNAKGDFVQTGGTFTQGTKESYIGWYGGIGRYAFSGDGTANFASSDVSLGANGGKGTLEIGAGTGTFTAKTLSVAGAESALKFVLGADGSLATLNVTGTFTVASGAKLVVDATKYTGKEPVTLMTFASKTGAFADADISVIGAGSSSWNVKSLADRLELRNQNYGLTIFVR
jgi:hypothetical protein